MPDIRYALYYAPPEGSALALLGASWLGWDAATGTALPHSKAPVDVDRMTKTPRKYGFHGTLKPPFRLAEGQDVGGLDAAIRELCQGITPFDAPPLVLKAIGSFIALVPSAPCPELAELAGTFVGQLDPFRAPPSEIELARRQAKGLTPRQAEHLARWGYPYVFDTFRFHLTLTGALEPADQAAAFACLTPLTAPFAAEPMPVREVCLFQQIDGAPFGIAHRYPLTG